MEVRVVQRGDDGAYIIVFSNLAECAVEYADSKHDAEQVAKGFTRGYETAMAVMRESSKGKAK